MKPIAASLRLVPLGWFVAAALVLPSVRAEKRPNIIVIYGDDVGYGDLGCYGAGHIKTPGIDRLAENGMRFTDAYATSSTCTPSRYALLTGVYPWRVPAGRDILDGDAPLAIRTDQPTLPRMLQKAGYATGMIGKWHLGLGSGDLNWNRDIKPGPLEIGFGASFIIPSTPDRVPCVYVDGHHVAGLDLLDPLVVDYRQPVGPDPLGREHPEMLKMKVCHGHDGTIVNGISRVGFMSGGYAARWIDEDMADTLTSRTIDFIEENRGHPFFLYFATNSIHVPRSPNARFVGRSGLGLRGDAILEFDDSVSRVMAAVDRLGLRENTLVILSSDNGPVVDDGYFDQSIDLLDGHTPAGPLRGGKYSAFEGGTRVPLIVSWPGHVKSGISPALVSQVDLFGSVAALLGLGASAEVPGDSRDASAAWFGNDRRGRDHVIEQAVNNALSVRVPAWKYIEPSEGPAVIANPNIESGFASTPQLYHVADDAAEHRNIAAENPGKVRDLAAILDREAGLGRSVTPVPEIRFSRGGATAGESAGTKNELQNAVQKRTSPESVGRLLVDRFVGKLKHQNFGRPDQPDFVTYPEVCTWYGALTFSAVTGDGDRRAALVKRFEPLLGPVRWPDHPFADSRGMVDERQMVPAPDHVDHTVFGAVPCELYIQTKDPRYLELGRMLADQQWADPDWKWPFDHPVMRKYFPEHVTEEARAWRQQGYSWQTRIWIDDMYMITAVQAQAFRATGDRTYIDRAAKEMALYLGRIQQPNGLFHHAPSAPYFWGRGNGWMAAGMSELLRSLPGDHPERTTIINGYRKMMATLLQYQRADGMWRQLVDDPDAWPETSCTGMFAFAFITGVKEGWLDEATYGPAAQRAWQALTSYIDENGDVREVCQGTNIHDPKNSSHGADGRTFYLGRKRLVGDMHGQAPVLWCATALLR